MTDLLITNSIGPGFTKSSAESGIGGSELEIVLIAHALARRGHTVTVANGVETEFYEEGVRYVPLGSLPANTATRALWIERMTMVPESGIRAGRIVVRATDICCPPYDTVRSLLESGRATLVANTRWQADGFTYATKKAIIAPAMDLSLGGPPPEKEPGLFVFASAPQKGLGATLEMWRALKKKHKKELKKTRLVCAFPGRFDFYQDRAIPLTDEDKMLGVSYAPSLSLVDYRRTIASAEGLFFVDRMPETFCCAAAFAESYGTRTHVLCLNGKSGIPEALANSILVTEDPEKFEHQFLECWQSAEHRERWYAAKVQDRSPDALAVLWEDVLGLSSKPAAVVSSSSKTGTNLGFYEHKGMRAQRYWVHDRILVGGAITSSNDTDTLKLLGVTHVLSAEDQADDTGLWSDDSRTRSAWEDGGQDVPDEKLHALMEAADRFASDGTSVFYAHCHLGGSRGPTVAYLILRSAFQVAPAEAMSLIRTGHHDKSWTPHLRYIDSIERALTTRGSRKLDLAHAQENVLEAYRLTPTPQSRAALERLRPDDAPTRAAEATLPTEELPKNTGPFAHDLEKRFSALRSALAPGGTEMGALLFLTSLVASTRAARVCEIGRFRGLSTVALATGLALADESWTDAGGRPRPDVDYDTLLGSQDRKLFSVERFPDPAADELLRKTGLTKYVEKIDKSSDDTDPGAFAPVDVLYVDGEKEYGQVRRDLRRYVPHVRTGGYVLLHDWYGWFDRSGESASPARRAAEKELEGLERVVLDTGFASLAIFRKTRDLVPAPARVPPRADGRPTVGLVLVTIGREASTVVARALVSASRAGVDTMTVLVDPLGGGEETADVARHIGADVHVRPTPKVDWEKGIGSIAGARNDALELAEQKTDYVLILDADDTLSGKIPDKLTHDVYELPIHDSNVIYRRAQMWKSGRGFRYVGIIHENIVAAGSVGQVETLKYMRRFGGGHQDSVPKAEKYMRHARLAAQWLAGHPDDTRSQFYLAQSYRDAGRSDDAIREYERRITMGGGFLEELAFSAYQIGNILREQKKDPTEAYLRSFELNPTRAEPLTELALWLRSEDRKRFVLGAMVAKRASELPLPHGQSLFVQPDVYEWRALDEYAIHVFWAGDKRASLRAYEELRGRVPAHLRAHVEEMIVLCKRHLGIP